MVRASWFTVQGSRFKAWASCPTLTSTPAGISVSLFHSAGLACCVAMTFALKVNASQAWRPEGRSV